MVFCSTVCTTYTSTASSRGELGCPRDGRAGWPRDLSHRLRLLGLLDEPGQLFLAKVQGSLHLSLLLWAMTRHLGVITDQLLLRLRPALGLRVTRLQVALTGLMLLQLAAQLLD
eukprot:scaffold135146_cov66-Phaeocystis_antarctica.AAC.6